MTWSCNGIWLLLVSVVGCWMAVIAVTCFLVLSDDGLVMNCMLVVSNLYGLGIGTVLKGLLLDGSLLGDLPVVRH